MRASFSIICALVLLILFETGAEAEAPLLVKIAESQLGRGEMYGDNRGPEVEKYTRGKDVAWCAGFVSWVRAESGSRDAYLLSARSYWNRYRGKAVGRPESGDLIVFSRGPGKGHIGIVERVRGDTVTSIEGNVGPFPAKVRKFHYRLGHIKNLLGFIRLQ